MGCWPTLPWRKPQAGSGWSVSQPSLWSSSLATSSRFRSFSDVDIIVLDPFFHYLDSMFRIIVLLVLPVAAELEFLSGFLQVFIKDPDVILLSHDSLDLDEVPCATGREASPCHYVSTDAEISALGRPRLHLADLRPASGRIQS